MDTRERNENIEVKEITLDDEIAKLISKDEILKSDNFQESLIYNLVNKLDTKEELTERFYMEIKEDKSAQKMLKFHIHSSS